MSRPSDEKDPLTLPGIRQALFVLDCLEQGHDEQEIANKFDGDTQLVKMWMSFLRHNKWIEQPDGRWISTKKGREWVSRYDKH